MPVGLAAGDAQPGPRLECTCVRHVCGLAIMVGAVVLQHADALSLPCRTSGLFPLVMEVVGQSVGSAVATCMPACLPACLLGKRTTEQTWLAWLMPIMPQYWHCVP
jgi:hypothetical protein